MTAQDFEKILAEEGLAEFTEEFLRACPDFATLASLNEGLLVRKLKKLKEECPTLFLSRADFGRAVCKFLTRQYPRRRTEKKRLTMIELNYDKPINNDDKTKRS